jgi:agmatinase
MAAADALYEIMSIMVKKGPLSAMEYEYDEEDL